MRVELTVWEPGFEVIPTARNPFNGNKLYLLFRYLFLKSISFYFTVIYKICLVLEMCTIIFCPPIPPIFFFKLKLSLESRSTLFIYVITPIMGRDFHRCNNFYLFFFNGRPLEFPGSHFVNCGLRRYHTDDI